MTFLLLERNGSLTIGAMWRTIWSLGNKCSSPPATAAIAAERPLVAAVGSKIETAGSLSTQAPQSWLKSDALL